MLCEQTVKSSQSRSLWLTGPESPGVEIFEETLGLIEMFDVFWLKDAAHLDIEICVVLSCRPDRKDEVVRVQGCDLPLIRPTSNKACFLVDKCLQGPFDLVEKSRRAWTISFANNRLSRG